MNQVATSSSLTTTTINSSTLTEEEKDKQYSHEIAKRSVARAALHLGITSMSSEALDVMGDALLTFLERLGGYISESAECSSRSSSHCNVLDALQGVECMSGNIISTEMPFGDNNSNSYTATTSSTSNSNDNANQTSWEALAAFGYGASWRQPSDITAASTNNNNNNEEENANGWNAPYLDVIPNYPLRRYGNWKSTQYKALEEEACSTSTSNDNKKDPKEEEEASKRAETHINHLLNAIPDVFWGSEIPKEDEKEESVPPPTKRVKLSIPNEEQQFIPTTAHRPSYLPSFLPSFPPFYTYQHPSSQPKHPTQQQRHLQDGNATTDSSMNVRRSLVQLHQVSHDTSTTQAGDDDNATAKEENSLVVPLGVDRDSSQEKNISAVMALTKASGSRIPRILEGSMDTVPC